MPVEIKELIIRTNIVDPNNTVKDSTMSEKNLEEIKQEITQECLRTLSIEKTRTKER